MSETGPNLRALGPFEPGLSTAVRGQRMVWLVECLRKDWYARQANLPALCSRLQAPDTHQAALDAIERLPSRALRDVIACYAKKAKGR